MFTWFKKRSRSTRIGLGVIVVLVVLYVLTSYTMHGRITALYLFGGMGVPWATKSACIEVVGDRVTQKFALPLDMDREARNALREYWHYSYYRQCLYDSGYDFSGNPVPLSTLVEESGHVTYTNVLANMIFTLPVGTDITMDNELDVDFDYRLFRSSFTVGRATVFVHTYTIHDDVASFADLAINLDHLSATEGTITTATEHVADQGVPYLAVIQDDGYCGSVFVAPAGQVVHIYTVCDDSALVEEMSTTAMFITQETAADTN